MSISFNTMHTDTSSYSSIRSMDPDPRFKKIEAGVHAQENYTICYEGCSGLTFLAGLVAMLACGILALQGNLLGVSEGGAYAMAIIGGLGILAILISICAIPALIKAESQRKLAAAMEVGVEEELNQMQAANKKDIARMEAINKEIAKQTANITQVNTNDARQVAMNTFLDSII